MKPAKTNSKPTHAPFRQWDGFALIAKLRFAFFLIKNDQRKKIPTINKEGKSTSRVILVIPCMFIALEYYEFLKKHLYNDPLQARGWKPEAGVKAPIEQKAR